MFTTVEDMARWDRNFYTAGVGGSKVIEQMHIRGRLNDGTEIPYAVGLSHGTYRGLKTVSHGGADAGYRSHFIRFPEQRFSSVVLCNFPTSGPGDLARKIADVYLAEDFTEPPEEYSPIKLSPAELVLFVGVYRHPAADTVWTLSMKDGHLVVGTDQPRALQPLGEGQFRIESSSTVVKLVGTPAALHVPAVANRHIIYEKLERSNPNIEELAAYVGSYHSDELGAEYAFEVENGKLVLRNRKIGRKELIPTYEDGFTFQGYGMTFTRDTRGQVNGFTLSSGRVRRVRFEKT